MQENPLLRWLICIPSLVDLALGWDLNFLPCRPLCRAAWISSKHGSQLPLELVISGKLRQKKPEYFYDLIPKVIRYHFHNIWLVTKISLIHCGNLYKTQNPGGANYWGALRFWFYTFDIFNQIFAKVFSSFCML